MVSVILHNIRSVFNVGSIFRTADAARVAQVYLTGYTPAPVDRFWRKRKDFAKVSLGAEETVPWERAKNISPLLTRLKKEKTFLVAVEQSPHSINYKKIPPIYRQVRRKQNIAFIFGNEVQGLSLSVLKKCDCIAEIPMRGSKESLNVSVAAGIVLYRLFD